MKSLQDKIVVVTGASRGLGLELARTFAAEGCRVAMAARDQRTLTDAAEKIADSGGQTLPFACDVTRRDEVDEFAQRVMTVWGSAQILINNAGIARAMRFYLVAALLYFFGQPIREFIERRLTLVTTVFVVVLVSGFVAVKYLF